MNVQFNHIVNQVNQIVFVSSPLPPQAQFKIVPFGVARQKLIEAKRAANLSEIYLESLDQYLDQFGRGRQDMGVHEFQVEHLQEWFMNRNEAPQTRASNTGRLSSLFGYAVRQKWRPDNPCLCLDRIKIDLELPRRLSPAQATSLIRTCRTVNVAFTALAMFEGVRPESELAHMIWEKDIDLKRGTASLLESKTWPRVLQLHPITIQWLEKIPKCMRHGLVAPSVQTLRRYRIRARSFGIEWSHDVLRHTAASYQIALYKDVGIVATRLGNSPKTLSKRYHNPVSQEDNEVFWKIFPTAHSLNCSDNPFLFQ